MHEIFISYASADQAIANRVVRGLEQHGLSCWISSREIKPGADYQASIAAAIDASVAVVVLFSRKSLASTEVPKEMSLAGAARKPLIPLRLENIEPSGAFRYQLANAQYVDLFQDFETKLNELCLHLDEICNRCGEVARNVHLATRRRNLRSWAGRFGLAIAASLAAMLAWKAAPSLHAALDQEGTNSAAETANRDGRTELSQAGTGPAAESPAADRAATPESQARAFATTYYEMTGAAAPQSLAFLSRAVADPIRFFGQTISRDKLIGDQRIYIQRWPERRFTIRPGSLVASCGYGTSCEVSGIDEYDLKSPQRNAGAAGAERFSMQITGIGGNPVVTAYISTPVMRRTYSLQGNSAQPEDASLQPASVRN